MRQPPFSLPKSATDFVIETTKNKRRLKNQIEFFDYPN